jgi:hypothetical protein
MGCALNRREDCNLCPELLPESGTCGFEAETDLLHSSWECDRVLKKRVGNPRLRKDPLFRTTG